MKNLLQGLAAHQKKPKVTSFANTGKKTALKLDSAHIITVLVTLIIAVVSNKEATNV